MSDSNLAAIGEDLPINARYEQWLARKQIFVNPSGLDVHLEEINQALYPFQRDVVRWSLSRGKAAIFADCGLGKALRSSIPVFTNQGWRAIGELTPGCRVAGTDGRFHEVMGVYPQGMRDLYRITFSDGATVDCDSEHLWSVKTQLQRYRGRQGRTLTTEEIMREGLADEVGRRRHFIPLMKALELPPAELPIDPYTLGVLLGDGSLSDGTVEITTDDEIVAALLLPVGVKAIHAKTVSYGTSSYRLSCGVRGANNPLTQSLRSLGLKGHRAEGKFIPEPYKWGSIEQRKDLLAGLLDTDGSVFEGTVEFSTVSERLAKDIIQLVQSLGGLAHLGVRKSPTFTHKGEQRHGQDAYRLNIKLPGDWCPFRLSRKRQAWTPRCREEPPRAIVSIEPIERDQAVCIAVNSPDHLFVIEHFVVTHNTPMQLEWSRLISERTGGNVLIVAPLAVAQQTVHEGEKFGVSVTICRQPEDIRPGVNITNYELIHKFKASEFAGIVLDECFAPGTLVDTVTSDGRVRATPIKDVRTGDRILNAAGVDEVADVHRREVSYAVQIFVAGHSITCSPNHPFFTQRGWVGAQDLVPGDHILETATAMRMVRDGVHPQVLGPEEAAVLRDILLSEMAYEATGAPGEGAQSNRGCEARGKEAVLALVGRSEGEQRDRAYPATQSHVEPRNPGESLPPIESHAPRTFRAWGQRAWFDGASADTAACVGVQLASGVCFVTGPTDSGLSHALQTRLGESRAKSRHRGGWFIPQVSGTTGAGLQEDRETGFARVDGLEVLKPGDSRLEELRDADGRIYLYDLGATRHPSFSVNGLLVHNSSILKAFSGVYRRELTEFAEKIPFRLACTATPAPNDLVEVINHAEFLGVMKGKEMIALFFTQDGNTTHSWRLKGHAKHDFWRWMATWCVALRSPRDLGYDDDRFVLPPLEVHQHTVLVKHDFTSTIFPMEATTLPERQRARKDSLEERVHRCAELVNGSDRPWIVWCNLNTESAMLTRAIPDAVEVTGSDSPEFKEKAMVDFAAGRIRVLVTKPSIAGWGMNWQHCADVAFVGLSDSWESYYQAVRRCWRFGQTQPVNVHIITAETEGAVVRNIERKEREAGRMFDEIIQHMNGLQLGRTERQEAEYAEEVLQGPAWTLYLGDSIKVIDRLESESVGFSVFSPPFPGMYAYTNSAHDMGNCEHIDEMIEHFRFLVGPEKLLRVLKPGRLVAIHLMQLTAMLSRDGYIGIKDYRGRVIAMMEQEGWIYHGEVTIDKNPQIQATRNKERGLLFKTLATDSANMRMALADYLLYFKKPGQNQESIRAGMSPKYNAGAGWISEQEWIEWAAPVWYRQTPHYPGGIRETEVLNVRQAKETDDERHLCPLQLGVIRRAIKLWSNPKDLVFSPFAGIGSEGYVSVELDRRFVGIELKRSYWETSHQNLQAAYQLRQGSPQRTLFDLVVPDEGT